MASHAATSRFRARRLSEHDQMAAALERLHAVPSVLFEQLEQVFQFSSGAQPARAGLVGTSHAPEVIG